MSVQDSQSPSGLNQEFSGKSTGAWKKLGKWLGDTFSNIHHAHPGHGWNYSSTNDKADRVHDRRHDLM